MSTAEAIVAVAMLAIGVPVWGAIAALLIRERRNGR